MLRRPLLAIVLLASATRATDPPLLAGCPALPSDNIWNAPVDTLPVDKQSSAFVATSGPDAPLHADFGSGLFQGAAPGIPFTTVAGLQPKVSILFDYGDESDPGPYPIPPDAPIEGGSSSKGDRHVLVVDRDACILYELYNAFPAAGGGWRAGSGAVYDLRSNALRPSTWTSADAAGLPMLPGLARYSEVAAGEIRHALRFTVPKTRREFVWPARHFASTLTGAEYPPMGQRFRLKKDFDISGFSKQAQVILTALKKYGMILADNGSSWFISGAPDEGWDNNVLSALRRVHGSDFEAVDSSSLMVNENSGKARAQIRAAVNAASYAGDTYAPGEIVSIFGASLSGPVLVDGAPAQTLAVTPDQINVRLPDSLAPGSSRLQVADSGPWPLRIVPSAPGLFPVVQNEDGTVNSIDNAAQAGSVISVFATGGSLDSISASIGEVVTVEAAGSVTRVAVHLGPATGVIPVVLTFGGVPTQSGVTVAVK